MAGFWKAIQEESSKDHQSGDADLKQIDDVPNLPDLFMVKSYTPPPDDLRVRDGDTCYLSWFVYQGPVFMGIGLVFPSLCCHMYALSTQHSVLHEAILVFAAHFSNLTAGRIHSDVYRRLSLLRPKLQQALVTGKLDDRHIVAVFLIAALYHYGGNLNVAATHLHGLSVMLAYDQRRNRSEGRRPQAPLISFVQRQCIRFFNQLASTR